MMLTKTKTSGVLIIAAVAVALTVYGCSKNGSSEMSKEITEQVLFEDTSDKTFYKPGDFLLGGNVKKVTSIGTDHPVFVQIKSTAGWKQAASNVELDLTQIKRTYVHNTDASLVTIPIVSNEKAKEYFNVYVNDSDVLITRFSEIRQPGGITTCEVRSPLGELYYRFDINNLNQIGNWKFDKDLPKLSASRSSISLTGREVVDCSKKKFSSCMNCVILDVCGSDWICSIACGLAIPSCVGGAALYCLIS
jgi:hypothetical protein